MDQCRNTNTRQTSLKIVCRLKINEPVEHGSTMLPPNFEFPVYEAMVEEDEEIPDEIRWMLEQERKAIQPHQEEI